jgi:hypothetical protein
MSAFCVGASCNFTGTIVIRFRFDEDVGPFDAMLLNKMFNGQIGFAAAFEAGCYRIAPKSSPFAAEVMRQPMP